MKVAICAAAVAAFLTAPSTSQAGRADLGTKVADAAHQEGVALVAVIKHPAALNLRVTSEPSQNIYLETSTRCRKGERASTAKEQLVRGSNFVDELDLSFHHPDRCKFFGFVRYPRVAGQGVVGLSLYKKHR